MTKRERVAAALRRAEVDRVPISFWRHFPGDDATPEQLTAATLAFYRRYDVDFVKLMPTGMYCVQDYGCEIELAAGEVGTTRVVRSVINGVADWGRLPEVDITRGVFGDQVEVVRRVRAALGPDVPVVQTIFSPLTVAQKLAGDRFSEHLHNGGAALEAALGKIADDTIAFGRACLDAGADGFFFATQVGGRGQLDDAAFDRLARRHDLRVLRALRDGAWFTLLHLHGPQPRFELANEYPVDALNWHDRETPPSIAQAFAMTTRALAAGIHRDGVIRHGIPEQVAAEVCDAAAQTGGRGVLVAPGCVVPTGAPDANLRAARRAVG